MIRQWFGVARYVYNQTLELLRDGVIKANWKAIKGDILNNLPDWCKETPYQIKSIAIKDACKAVSNAKLKYKSSGVASDFKFRSRKNPKQSCYIPKSAVSSKGIYHTILGEVKFAEALPKNFGDCRLVFVYGDYYLTLPEESLQLETENQGRVVALDPGIRTFLTFYSESSFGWLGKNANLKIQKLCFKLDELCSGVAKTTGQSKRRLKKAANHLRAKIKNLVSELHKKTAKFLVDNFDVILLPTFETSQMSKKGKRRIRSKSVRQMLTLSHYQFKQFIKHKAFEYSKVVLDVNEAYTSKTVSWTGEVVKIGGSKIIKSPSTGQAMDRDLNGARGIFLHTNPHLLEELCAPGQLRRMECAWTIEQAIIATYQVQNEISVVSDRLLDLQHRIREDACMVIKRCESHNELDFLFPEITRIQNHDLIVLESWQSHIGWTRTLPPLELEILNSTDFNSSEIITISGNNQAKTIIEIPSEQILYENLAEKTHFYSLRDQLLFMFEPALRRKYEFYIARQSAITGYKTLLKSNLEQASDIALANLYYYFKVRDESEDEAELVSEENPDKQSN
ncbi:hypothetical protein NUACC21_39150 [Scytonema sp. NUACC21]